MVRIRSLWRPNVHEKPAICGPFCTEKIIFYESRTGWLGREDSNLRMGESKSPALPLGDAPIALNGSRQDQVLPPRAARCRKVAGRFPAGSPEPHRFTVAAEVLEHFPPKWKPAFGPENAARNGKIGPIQVSGPAFASRRRFGSGGGSGLALCIGRKPAPWHT